MANARGRTGRTARASALDVIDGVGLHEAHDDPLEQRAHRRNHAAEPHVSQTLVLNVLVFTLPTKPRTQFSWRYRKEKRSEMDMV
eukprot:3038303-Rhodomonas_salina.1